MRPRKRQEKQVCVICDEPVAAGWVYSQIPRILMPLCDEHLCCPDCGASTEWLDLDSDGEFKFRCRRCYYERRYRSRVLTDIQAYHHDIEDENEDS